MDIHAVYGKHILGQINAACTNLHDGRSFLLVVDLDNLTMAFQCRHWKDASIPLLHKLAGIPRLPPTSVA
jgi:hypothetical protein